MSATDKEMGAAQLAYEEIIAIIENLPQVLKEKLMETMFRIERDWGPEKRNARLSLLSSQLTAYRVETLGDQVEKSWKPGADLSILQLKSDGILEVTDMIANRVGDSAGGAP